jgi:Flp pilus assembly protein TadD
VSFVFALAIVVSPVLAKNYAVSQTLSIQGYGGLNVYIGNSPLHDGRATFRLGKGWDALNSEAMRSGITDPAAQDRYYLRKTFSEVTSNPLGYVRLLARKTLWMLQAEEPRDTHSYYFFTDRSSLLRMLLRFAVLFPLACIGVFAITRPTLPLHVNRRWTSQPAVTLLAFYTLAVAATEIFLVIGLRYRMPLVPALAILAGAGADGAVRLAEARRTRQLLICCAIALTAVIVSHVLHDPSNVNVAEEWAFTGSSLITEHKLPDAEQAYRRALELEPQSALAWDGLGLTLYNAGRLDEARTALQRALAIDPQSARAAFHLALVDEREGRLESAASGYERALSLSPYDSEVLGQLAAVRRKHATELGMAGRTREARDEMKRALDASAADGETWLDLCLLSLDLGDREEAAAALQRAKNLGADPARIAFAEQAFRR